MLVVVDYGVSNIRSVLNALGSLGIDTQVAKSPPEVHRARKLILPGVGSFGAAVSRLRERGIFHALQTSVTNGTPILGICLGMQLLFDASAESPGISGLGLLEGVATDFGDAIPGLTTPTHMGFSPVYYGSNSELFTGIDQGNDFYFVHSYCLPATGDRNVAIAQFGHQNFAAAIEHNNQIFGTQFHPERSQGNGLTLLRNFSRL